MFSDMRVDLRGDLRGDFRDSLLAPKHTFYDCVVERDDVARGARVWYPRTRLSAARITGDPIEANTHKVLL